MNKNVKTKKPTHQTQKISTKQIKTTTTQNNKQIKNIETYNPKKQKQKSKQKT